MSRITGKVAQIIGPVVDVVFNDANAELPKIYDSLEITKKDGTLLVLEVQSHIGEKTFKIFTDLPKARHIIQYLEASQPKNMVTHSL